MERSPTPILIDVTLQSHWPALAWLATISIDADESLAISCHVDYGPHVEVRSDWCVEGIWTGPFESGDFDRKDLFFGSGVRLRDGVLRFIGPNSPLDRLVSFSCHGKIYISNSLPAILAASGARLLPDYDYRHCLMRSLSGESPLEVSFPAVLPAEVGSSTNGPESSVQMSFWYLTNLELTLQGLELGIRPSAHPDQAPAFNDFTGYLSYLRSSLNSLNDNARDQRRAHAFMSNVALSSGYDSSMVAVLLAELGCDRAVSIEQARSLKTADDSGRTLAELLQLDLVMASRSQHLFRDELAVWAAHGDPADLNLSILPVTQPPTVLFTGYLGDTVWGKSRAETLHRDTVGGMGISEYRLSAGVIHCPVALFGYRHLAQISQISFSEELAPWTLHTDYDRPICRRVVEERGMRRGSFAVRKKATTFGDERLWPYQWGLQLDYIRYLRRRARLGWGIILSAMLSAPVNYLARTFLKPLGLMLQLRILTRLEYLARANRYIFQWANEKLRERYRQDRAPKQISSRQC